MYLIQNSDVTALKHDAIIHTLEFIGSGIKNLSCIHATPFRTDCLCSVVTPKESPVLATSVPRGGGGDGECRVSPEVLVRSIGEVSIRALLCSERAQQLPPTTQRQKCSSQLSVRSLSNTPQVFQLGGKITRRSLIDVTVSARIPMKGKKMGSQAEAQRVMDV